MTLSTLRAWLSEQSPRDSQRTHPPAPNPVSPLFTSTYGGRLRTLHPYVPLPIAFFRTLRAQILIAVFGALGAQKRPAWQQAPAPSSSFCQASVIARPTPCLDTTYLPTYLLTYLQTCLPTNLPTCLLTYLPTQIPPPFQQAPPLHRYVGR